MKKLVLILGYFFFHTISFAQSGLEIIQSALQQMDKWKDVTTVNYRSHQISYNKWQSYDYFKPSGNRNELQFSYDLKNSRYFYTTDSYFGGGYHFSYSNIGKDSLRYTFDNNGSRDGKQMAKPGKAQFIAGTSFLQQFIPYYLLKTLAARKDFLYLVKDPAYTIVRRDIKTGGHESYYFNAQQQLVKVVTVQPAQQTERIFKNNKEVNGLSYASIIENYLNGVLFGRDSLYDVNTKPFDESKLQVPQGYTIDTASYQPKVTALSERVHLIEHVPGGRNMIFVEFPDGVFVTEAPLSNEVSQAMIDLIHKTVPGKPIKYVHLSHFHNDHTNGIRAFAAEGATIVAANETIEVIRTITDDSSGRFKDKFSAMHTSAKFQTLNVFNQNVGKDAIELFEVKNNHAKGLSFVYLPKEKIVYEGDLYSLPDDGTITPAIEITRQFAAFMRSKNIKPVHIIGHHGSSNITPMILEKALVLKSK
jgi:glyoxylase-like metal-dependent hydrolase (beta-lactamase superfamily II)